jgi:aspartate aminotransferase, cytoplasmic
MPTSKGFDPSYHADSVRRVTSLVKQMSPPSTTSFTAEVVPQAPEDPLFGLMRAYKADQSPNKVDLVSWNSLALASANTIQ